MEEKPVKFLGFLIKAGLPRNKSPNSPNNIVGKPYPDMAKVRKKVNEIKKELKQLRYMVEEERQAAQIEQANAMIVGIAEYYKTAICSNAFNYIDDQINKSLYRVFRKKYGKKYRLYKVPLNDLSNRPQRHKGYQSQTFAIKCAGMHIGITKAFLTQVNG